MVKFGLGSGGRVEGALCAEVIRLSSFKKKKKDETVRQKSLGYLSKAHVSTALTL